MRPGQKVVSNDEESNMREIKFRAWVKSVNFKPKCKMIKEMKGIYIFHFSNGFEGIESHAGNRGIFIQGSWCELMQYTGLKDKNGKKIYEGDILNSKNDGKDGNDIWDYSTHDNRIVEWDAEYSCFSGMPDYGENSVYSEEYIEVIGNIYENPEVLKGEYK